MEHAHHSPSVCPFTMRGAARPSSSMRASSLVRVRVRASSLVRVGVSVRIRVRVGVGVRIRVRVRAPLWYYALLPTPPMMAAFSWPGGWWRMEGGGGVRVRVILKGGWTVHG